MNDKLEICKQTRKIAADALAVVLKGVLATDEPISEAKFRDLWLEEMRKSSEIYPDGWYIPPPHGMFVLFGTDDDFSRMVYESSRFEKVWPRDDIFLNRKKGLLFFYCSPV